jgi:hypothetical protein
LFWKKQFPNARKTNNPEELIEILTQLEAQVNGNNYHTLNEIIGPLCLRLEALDIDTALRYNETFTSHQFTDTAVSKERNKTVVKNTEIAEKLKEISSSFHHKQSLILADISKWLTYDQAVMYEFYRQYENKLESKDKTKLNRVLNLLEHDQN